MTISPILRPFRPVPAAAPEPITEEAAAWVVEIGTPSSVAPKMEVTAPMLAATPELAFSLVIRRPIVSMIFQPPHMVPRAIIE